MRIEDYALIGDCETAALVGRDGSIDWLCWPRFDSEACFAALLGSHDHGHWLICPKHSGARVVRRYRPNTLILETRFETPEGAVTLIDFMPPRGRHSNIVRMVIGERGRVPMATKLVFRFGYGAIVPWMTRLEDGTYRAIAGPDMVVLRTPVQLRGENLTTVGNFIIAAGETIPFVLTYSLSHLPPPVPRDPTTALEATEAFWRDWTGKCTAEGPWHEAVVRSLITGASGRAAQLGLSLLLAARRDTHLARHDACRHLPRGSGVARLDGAGSRGQRLSNPTAVRHQRRAPAA
jgi:GH15 family glucan-1,4-alpha-glucosidase